MNALEQGDLIEIDFTLAIGHEPGKVRPAVVATVYGFNSRSSLVMVIPVTRTDNGYPLHVPLSGQGAFGFACLEQMRTLDIGQRGYRYLGYVDDATMRQIMSIVRGMFGLK